MTKILAMSGSSRKDSLNVRALDTVTAIAIDKGAEVERLDLGELDIPIYDGDLEAASGLPEGVTRLRAAMLEADGLVIACPEYNGFMTPLLLNALDWASRAEGAKPDLAPFRDKVILITSASPGGFGGMRAAGHLRTMLSGIGSIVVPQGIAIPGAYDAFDDSGDFKDDGLRKRAESAVERFLDIAKKIGQ